MKGALNDDLTVWLRFERFIRQKNQAPSRPANALICTVAKCFNCSLTLTFINDQHPNLAENGPIQLGATLNAGWHDRCSRERRKQTEAASTQFSLLLGKSGGRSTWGYFPLFPR